MPSMKEVLVLALLLGIYALSAHSGGFLGNYPPGCDENAAHQCEYEFLKCKLFGGPAGDSTTLCRCGELFYGDCLRKAGCQTYPQVDVLSQHEIYMTLCIQEIIDNNCPSTLMCAMNCASDGSIDPAASKVLPFNNYGETYLRIRMCNRTVHPQRYNMYSFVNVVPCQTASDFQICNRWIPPHTFVPVALPIDTTYVEIDSCYFLHDGTPYCPSSPMSRLYGNSILFPSTFDVPRTNTSTCASNADCLGSFCDFHFVPPICSPKTMKHVVNTGKYYLSDPYAQIV